MGTMDVLVANSLLTVWLVGGFLFLLLLVHRREKPEKRAEANVAPHRDEGMRWLAESGSLSTPSRYLDI